MLQVLLVDDEPFIVRGLQVLIDWEQEGYQIAGTAANGMEALDFLRENEVDIIISDIKMPVMTGIELLEILRKEKISEAHFIILSGYSDFHFAQQAIRNNCLDYILKPVYKDDLLKVLHRTLYLNQGIEKQKQTNQQMEKAYLARNLISLFFGKYDQINLDYVNHHMRLSKGVRYVEIEFDNIGENTDITDEEKRTKQRKLYETCVEFLAKDECHCIFDVSSHERSYDIGFVYCDYMAEEFHMTEKEYLSGFLNFLNKKMEMHVAILVGKKVQDVSGISKSYGTVCNLRSFQAFRTKKDIYYYEEEMQVNQGGIILCKERLDSLLTAVEHNNQTEIIKSVDALYQEMHQVGMLGDTINLNINYLLFQFIHLASQQDSDVNQEEIMRFISENAFEESFLRGSREHLKSFACAYAEYLTQLRKKVSRGVLFEVEKNIRENYFENLTLRELSKKYYVNSAYLGQMFRKKYGLSFKDYLNNFRIEQAAMKLIRTDKKVYQIAEEVGYHDLDYFIDRFISNKGCTPAKFRKQSRE